ncbi:hypothetical protein MPTK1_2g02410 [Marchantia polymorpha subsp. ruderalis]|uniref:Uncharacterized protein n=1 Tax=Marchantia polymorpha TaxID=3197 RepID=A0A2R6W8B1_MARPO|nr:hypothetical protein MARPO_0130s0048 [Marchantia polymorpha]BBN00821.1 hypothetical protein Mp_2g02410 [Marchantia polymorpha subsp. ruderalis]|eukprot:PTQ30098.1 hypothetical protein MARPO_0130s0048 [Marchantia polymorpha]
MASYNDVFGDDDCPSWLTAGKEDDCQSCQFSLVMGVPVSFVRTSEEFGHLQGGYVSFEACMKSGLHSASESG